MKPIVAIVGKPNVGKSTFFNRLAGQRISIVDDRAGVTRDRLYAETDWCGREFTIIDTGGLELKSEDEMWRHIRTQAEIAVESADVIILIVDGKTGIQLDDQQVAAFLRKSNKPIVLAVNKLDNNEQDTIFDFYSLGLGEPFMLSAEQGKGLTDILDEVVRLLPEKQEDEGVTDEAIRVAIVGKPNAGKSSLVNKMLGYNRVIVSNIAGTTRDAIDSEIVLDGQKYIIVDTAGIRRKRSISEELEGYSVMRALGAIRRADVVVSVVDAEEGLTEQDVKIIGYAHEQGKPSVIVMNKWDLIEKDTNTVNKFQAQLKEDLKFMDYFQSCYISALTGKRANVVLPLVKKVRDNSLKRISTGLFNEVIGEAISVNEPPPKNGKRLRIFFASQVSVSPPTFVFFVNDAELVHFSYERYLENAIRKSFDFDGTPIKLFFRTRKKNET